MSGIVAHLFGGIEFHAADGRRLTLSTRKARALLAFLIVERGRWHTRARLAGLLWGDRLDIQARNSLNQALYELRKIETAYGVCLVERQTERVRLVDGGVECDLFRFETLLASSPLAAAELAEAPLLERLDLPEADFTAWLDGKRTECREGLAQALFKLASTATETIEDRLAAARRLVALDSLDEGARRLLMILLTASGDRVEAIRQYEVCAALLRDELGIEPDAETRAVLTQIRRSANDGAKAFPHDERQDLVDGATADARPVVAVLPFANLSDDSSLAPFADGVADDVLFSLSRLRWFRVLARRATFAVRDVMSDPRAIQRFLGASHIVSGGVRRAGNRLRVMVELTDVRTGQQLWSNRYDKALDDLFDMQDEIVRNVSAGIEPALANSEMVRALGRPPDTLAAYDLRQLGYWHLYRETPADDEQAGRCFEEALVKDPAYASALAGLGNVRYRQAHGNWANGTLFAQGMAECRKTSAQAVVLDPSDPCALRWLGGANSFSGDQESAVDALCRSIELSPSYATAYSGLAFAHDFNGDFSIAAQAADQTIRLRPHDPTLYKCISSKAIACYLTGNYVQADRIARSSLRGNTTFWLANLILAASAGQCGRPDNAVPSIERLRNQLRGVQLDIVLQRLPFADPAHIDHLSEGMRRAGWKD